MGLDFDHLKPLQRKMKKYCIGNPQKLCGNLPWIFSLFTEEVHQLNTDKYIYFGYQNWAKRFTAEATKIAPNIINIIDDIISWDL